MDRDYYQLPIPLPYNLAIRPTAVGYPTIAPEDRPKLPAFLAAQSQVVAKSVDCPRGIALSDWKADQLPMAALAIYLCKDIALSGL